MKAYGIPDKLIRMVKIMCEDFECSVLDEGTKQEQTRWFKITTGVKQGCVMSGFLFLIAVDRVMRRTTEGQRNGIRWNFTSTLEDLDFADDIVLLSSKYQQIQDKTNRLVDNAGRVGLKLNAQKCKVMRMSARREDKVMIERKEVEDVEEFVYLGATVTKEGGGTEDIKKRLSKAQGAFYNLKKIWNTRSIGRNTKLKLFKTLVQPVLLYGCEAWKLTAAEEKKLDRFQFTCLRRILRVWWPQRIRNDTISQITGVRKISDEIRRRRWNWIGHVLRKDRNDDCMVAMGGNLRGRGKWADLKSRGEGQWKESADKKGGPAGLKPGPQQKTGLVGKRKLQPYAPYGAERTN